MQLIFACGPFNYLMNVTQAKAQWNSISHRIWIEVYKESFARSHGERSCEVLFEKNATWKIGKIIWTLKFLIWQHVLILNVLYSHEQNQLSFPVKSEWHVDKGIRGSRRSQALFIV